MKIAYICHPIKGDVAGNMDDNVPAERARGIYNDYEYFNRKMIDEVRVYGDVISEGMQAEIDLARRQGIPVVHWPYPPSVVPPEKTAHSHKKDQFEAKIDHVGRVYEAAKDGVYKGDSKAALDGLQELRNIACEALQKLYW